MDKKYRVVEHVGGGFSIQESIPIASWKNVGSLFYITAQGVYNFFTRRKISLDLVDFSSVIAQITSKEYYRLLADVEHANENVMNADNNKSYFASLRALVRRLDAFRDFYVKYPDFRNADKFPERAKVYAKFYQCSHDCDFSFYEQTLNSVDAYVLYGDRPFSKG